MSSLTPQPAPPTPDSLTETVRTRLLSLGFDLVRFAHIEGSAPGADALKSWLAAGMHGDMAWVERNADKRSNPGLIIPGARTIVVLGVNYFPGENPRDPGLPDWARYAQYVDYHDTILPSLKLAGLALEELCGLGPDGHRYYVDTGPVLERGWASRAGAGFLGKNAMLISRDFGNWLFLAAIVTSAELSPDAPLAGGLPDRSPGQLCGACTRCLDGCPTGALVKPGVLDARLCVSYLTIENKGPIPAHLRPLIGVRIYGCDTCAEICPWNRFARDSRSLLLSPRPEIASLGLRDILELGPERFAELFKGTPIKRIKLGGLLRNACVVAGNSGDTSLLPRLLFLARHGVPLVRQHAVWAARRLLAVMPEFGPKEQALEQLLAAKSAEADPAVLEEY